MVAKLSPNNLAVRAVGDIVEDIWDFIGFDETDMIMFQTGVTTGTVYTGNPLVGVAAGIVFSKGDNISKLIIKALSSNIFIKASSKAEALKAAESLPKAIQNNVTRAIKKTSGNYNDSSLKKLSNGNY